MGNEPALMEKIKDQITKCLGSADWTLKNETCKVSYSEKLELGVYVLKHGNNEAARFELDPMINCCGICVSTRASVNINYRNKGLGTLLNSLRIDIARSLGYGVLLCTDVDSNVFQRSILKANGWRDIHKFFNPRTHNVVCISIINL